MGRGAGKLKGKADHCKDSYVKKFELYFKVIHLVRDPRAMLASMLRSRPTWSRKIAAFEDYCDQILDDLKMAESMPRSR